MKDLVAQFRFNRRAVHHPVAADLILGYTRDEISHGRLSPEDETGPLEELRQLFGAGDIILPDEDF